MSYWKKPLNQQWEHMNLPTQLEWYTPNEEGNRRKLYLELQLEFLRRATTPIGDIAISRQTKAGQHFYCAAECIDCYGRIAVVSIALSCPLHAVWPNWDYSRISNGTPSTGARLKSYIPDEIRPKIIKCENEIKMLSKPPSHEQKAGMEPTTKQNVTTAEILWKECFGDQ